MTVELPEVLVDEEGIVYVWMNADTEEPLVMTQRDWAGLAIAVDTALCERQMDQSERIAQLAEEDLAGEMDPDWVQRALACAEGQEEAAMYEHLFGDQSLGKVIHGVFDCDHPEAEHWVNRGEEGCNQCGFSWGFTLVDTPPF